jgi:hypothetical protein
MIIKKVGDSWKKLKKTKRMPPAGTFFDYPFKNGGQLKMGVSQSTGILIF